MSDDQRASPGSEAEGEEVQALNDSSPSGDAAAPEEASAPQEPSSTETSAPRGKWRRRLVGAASGLVILALLAVAALSQTEGGQRMVLDGLLERVRGSLAGGLTVEGIRSGTLLTGLTLTGVRLDAEEGRRFLQADSIVVLYSPISLFLGSPRLRSTVVYGLWLEISRYSGDDFRNINRLLAQGPPDDSGPPSAPRTIQLGRLGVRGGTIEILTPAPAGPSALTVPGPGGGPLRRIAFEAVDLDLENILLRPGGAVAFEARLASLSTSLAVLDEPLVIHEAFGQLTFGSMGIRVHDGAFRLPSTLLEGTLRVGPDSPGDPWTLATTLESDGWGDLADLAWIDPRIPSGAFRGGVDVHIGDDIDVALTDLEVELEASRIVVDGRVRFGDVLVMESLVVTAGPLAVSRLEPWLGRKLPLDGWLSGRATFGGTFEDLEATGRMTFVPTGLGGDTTTAAFSGIIHRGDNPGATGLEVRLDPLDYGLLEALWPEARDAGIGSGTLAIEGRADDGVVLVADFTHAVDGASTSRVVGSAFLRRLEDGEWVTDVRGELAPLSLPALTRLWPRLALRGTIEGRVRADGRLSALHVAGDFVAAEGRLVLDGELDLSAPGSWYRLDAQADELRLSLVTDALPDPSVFSGHVALEGSGFALESLEATVSVTVRESLVGAFRIDTASATLRASRGVLTADTVEAYGAGVEVAGRGSFGMIAGTAGRAHFEFSTESLLGLRPIILGDSILVRDTLGTLDQELLRARGIDPDTLPTELDVRMDGALHGTADVSGSFDDFAVELLVELAHGAYRRNAVDSVRVTLIAGGLPGTQGDWDLDVGAHGVVWGGRQFEQVHLDGTMSQQRGEGTLDIVRGLSERYLVTGAFALDSLGGEVLLSDASAQVDDMSWALSEPSRIAWDSASLSVDSLQITRTDDDPMWLTATGTLVRGGASDFRLEMEGFHIEQATRIAQIEDLDVAGHIDLSVTIRGPAERPVINAEVQVEDPRYGSIQFSRLNGSLEYEGRSAEFRLDAWDGERNALTAVGTLPVDLALGDVDGRSVDEPMDVRVTADSLDAAIALAYLGTLQDVVGTVSGDVHIGGTTREPEPNGTVQLADAAWTIEALGVRHTGVTGDLLVRTDSTPFVPEHCQAPAEGAPSGLNPTVGVKLATTGTGASTVFGQVNFRPLSNPTLDLAVTFDQFQAVDRRDVESTITGEFALCGTYRLPVVEGTLTVDEGTLFVEEFARNAGVVDLSDPLLYAQGLGVDTTFFVTQPLLAGLRNPFLDNLRVAIDMVVPRNMWLRSSDMNVEMGGELLVHYDRGLNDLVLVGELEALRGSYLVLGRTFEVDGGTVEFPGQAGINPTLDIQALSRIRRRGGDPLEVSATVEGTLIQPLVTLSTEEAGLAPSDLVSLIVFGRASAELGADAGGVGTGLGQDLRTGGLTYFTGAALSRVGAAVAPVIGLDYLSISQAGAIGDADFVSNAQLEAGRYLGDDVFVVLVFSTPTDQAAGDEGGVSFLRGVRVEWALSDEYFLEGFVEDLFLRSGTAGLGAAGLDGVQVVGMYLFREWGYGSQQ